MNQIDELKNSQEFKDWIGGRVALIHNPYQDESFTFIVLHSDMGKWTITRFFRFLGDRINVSVDHIDKSTEEVFKILLSQYSSPLK